MRMRAEVRGDLAAIMAEETILASGAMRRGMEAAGKALQTELREQTARALPRGRSIANAWREKTYPRAGVVSLRPTSLVWSRAPNIISAFEEGEPITVRKGRFLCWPTGYNAAGGRRNSGSRGGLRVTPAQMVAARGQSVMIPARNNPGLYLWCLRVREATGTKRRSRNRTRLYIGSNTEVLTGRMKAGERAERAGDLLALGLVPMFYLKKTVNPGKRLDVAGAARKADAALPGHLSAALSRGP